MSLENTFEMTAQEYFLHRLIQILSKYMCNEIEEELNLLLSEIEEEKNARQNHTK